MCGALYHVQIKTDWETAGWINGLGGKVDAIYTARTSGRGYRWLRVNYT